MRHWLLHYAIEVEMDFIEHAVPDFTGLYFPEKPDSEPTSWRRRLEISPGNLWLWKKCRSGESYKDGRSDNKELYYRGRVFCDKNLHVVSA